MKPSINYSDYSELIDAIWEPLVEKNFSFVVKNEADETIGVALNFDANDEPAPPSCGMLDIIFKFLDELETPIK